MQKTIGEVQIMNKGARKRLTRQKVVIKKYLINFSYPIITRYDCCECPGAFRIAWKEAKIFKIREEVKYIYLTEIERATKKMYEQMFANMVKQAKFWSQNNDLYFDKKPLKIKKIIN